jgi:acetylxylan esterase
MGPRPAAAASLTQVTNFGANPSNLNMYVYVPNNVASHPALLVAMHYCQGSASALYNGYFHDYVTAADQYGYIIVFPEATRSGNCFDVYSPQALTRGGGSDPVGIVSMVQWVEQHNNGDSSRVYVTGASSGGMMTNVLIGDYPDVFKAGAAFMGVPFACFATTDGSMWNTACANGQISKTPQQWGDLARGAFPGYTGARPRMQLWHGTADTTLAYPNFGEEIKQWTNVLGVSQTPASTDTPQSGWTHTKYGNTGNQPPVEAYSIAGVGHSLPMSGMAAQAIRFFGLDSGTPPTTPISTPPTTSSPPPPPPGGCTVTDTIQSWNTGLTSNLTIANGGSSAINGWSLVFTLPSGQTITSGWSATYTPTSGQVTATNVSYDATIPANGSVSIGFQANHTGNTAKPASFALNGQQCTVG